MAVSTLDIAWLAGLLEGEGCFFVGPRNTPTHNYKRIGISLVMTDPEPVYKAAQLLGVNAYHETTKTSGGKSKYRLWSSGGQAAGWMMTLYSLLSPRRQAKIRECLEVWKQMPGRGANQYSRKEMRKLPIT